MFLGRKLHPTLKTDDNWEAFGNSEVTEMETIRVEYSDLGN